MLSKQLPNRSFDPPKLGWNLLKLTIKKCSAVFIANFERSEIFISSKTMCWIDNQSKKLVHLKHLILQTLYNFFSLFSWHFNFMHTESSITCIFAYRIWKKKCYFCYAYFYSFLFKYFQHWFTTIPNRST